MDRSFAILLMAVALPLLVLSCGDSGGVVPDTPPEAPALVSVEPEDGAAGLTGTSLSVVFTYDQNIKLPSAEQGKVSITGGGTVTKVNAYAQAVTVQVDGLEQGKTYTVSIPSGIVTGFKENQPGAAAASVRFTMKAEVSYGRDPQKTLTDPHATRRAAALYEFLLSQYGKKSLSGAMACSNGWDNTFTDMLGPLAGTCPAISGYDYLFLNWPPKAWNGCPDYGDITPVREAWEAGSLIQVCWHWSVPKSQAAYEARDPNQYAFYVSDNKASGRRMHWRQEPGSMRASTVRLKNWPVISSSSLTLISRLFSARSTRRRGTTPGVPGSGGVSTVPTLANNSGNISTTS